MLPLSREVQRLEWLKRSLTVYRLAFGQPRQEDLLAYLNSLLGTETAAEGLADLQIRLEPRDAFLPSSGAAPCAIPIREVPSLVDRVMLKVSEASTELLIRQA